MNPAAPQLIPAYQPFVNVYSGLIDGYEVLARERYGQELRSAGYWFTDANIPHQTKLNLDQQLREQAFSLWSTEQYPEFLSINLPPSYAAADDPSHSALLQQLEQSGFDPEQLVIELTEAAANSDQVQAIARHYRRAGAQIAIDDFGSENSQIERVLASRPNWLKLDMRLFQSARSSQLHKDVIHGIRYVVERNKINLICEGIETEDEALLAIDFGSTLLQGYLFAPASTEHLSRDHFQWLITSLRERYLTQKAFSIRLQERRLQQLKRLMSAFPNFTNESTLVQWPAKQLHNLGVLRMYIVETTGLQARGNFDIHPHVIEIDASARGRNWCCRPWFAQLVVQCELYNTVGASDFYRDIQTGKFCRTLARPLEDGRLLLIDAEADDLQFSINHEARQKLR